MRLPKMAKLDWYDVAKRRAVVEAAVALANEAIAGGADQVVEAYRALGPLIERELDDGTSIEPGVDAVWKNALRRIHEARYGFAPTRVTNAQLTSALPDVDAERLQPLADLAGDIAEYADGATLGQVANLVVKEAKARGLTVTRAQARRIVAAIEGAPIPAP